MQLNVKGEKRDQLRRARYNAITKRQLVVAGEPLKQFYPCYNQGKYTSLKATERKHGERRRINVALSNARYQHDHVILDDRATAITRLHKTSNYYA
jgi:hypothetical protein